MTVEEIIEIFEKCGLEWNLTYIRSFPSYITAVEFFSGLNIKREEFLWGFDHAFQEVVDEDIWKEFYNITSTYFHNYVQERNLNPPDGEEAANMLWQSFSSLYAGVLEKYWMEQAERWYLTGNLEDEY